MAAEGPAEPQPPPVPPGDSGAPSQRRPREKAPQRPAAPPPTHRTELRRAWRSGKAEASLWAELAEAEARGSLQAVEAHFPGGAGLLEEGQPLESAWARVVTRFGGGRASISLQFVLRPRRPDSADGPAAVATPPPPEGRRWHFLVRARELGRTSSGDDGEEEKHWAARLVLGTKNRREGSIAVAVPDHRSIWPECREVHSEHALDAGDAALQALREGRPLVWDVAVAVTDAGAPVAGAGRDLGDCC